MIYDDKKLTFDAKDAKGKHPVSTYNFLLKFKWKKLWEMFSLVSTLAEHPMGLNKPY